MVTLAIVSASMATGKPFDEIANVSFAQSEGKDLEATRDVLPAIDQCLAELRG